MKEQRFTRSLFRYTQDRQSAMIMTEEMLKEILLKFNRVKELEFELRMLYDTRKSVSSIQKVKFGSGKTSDPVSNAFHKMETVRADYEAALDDWLCDAERIEKWLHDCVPDTEVSAITRWHFLLGYDWRHTNIKVFHRYDYQFARKVFYRYMANNNLLEDIKPA